MDENELKIEEYKAFVTMCTAFFKDKTSDEVMYLAEVAALCALEAIAQNKGITNFSEYPEIAVQISHSIENSMRDYIDFHSDKEYMKRKTNLSSMFGSVVAEDTENAN